MKGNLARPHLLGFSDEGLKKCNHSSPAYILRQNKRRLTPQCRMGIVFFLPFNAGFLCLTKTIYIWWGYDCSTLPMHSTGSAALTPRSSAVLPKLFCPEHNRPKIRGTIAPAITVVQWPQRPDHMLWKSLFWLQFTGITNVACLPSSHQHLPDKSVNTLWDQGWPRDWNPAFEKGVLQVTL